MRWVLRSLIFSYATVFVAQELIGGFSFGGNSQQTMLLIMLGIALLNMFILPIFKVLGLPAHGVSFLVLNFVLTLVILYVLTMFVSDFEIVSTELAKLRIFGYVLPSKELTVMWATVYSALVISMVFHFLEWLCDKR